MDFLGWCVDRKLEGIAYAASPPPFLLIAARQSQEGLWPVISEEWHVPPWPHANTTAFTVMEALADPLPPALVQLNV